MRRRTAGGIFERDRSWWIDYRDGAGKRHREKIGRRAEALEQLHVRQREIREGKFVAPRSAGSARTFRDLARLALDNKRVRLAPQSYATDVRRLERILPAIGGIEVEQLGPDRLEELFAELRRSGLSGSTVNRYRSLVSSIFSFALRTGRISANPIQRVKRYKENESRVRYLREEEENHLRGVVRERFPDREAELDLALYTGMRRGEQWSLKWEDVDLNRGLLTVRGKTGRRYIEVNSSARAALELLASRRNGRAYVCPEAKSDTQRDWRRWLEKACHEAGVENFHWHDLRHTFASRLVMAGVDIRTVQSLLGHKAIQMTMRYAHLSPDHRHAAVEKIGARS